MGEEGQKVEYWDEGEGGGSGGHCGTDHWSLEAAPGQEKLEKGEQEKEDKRVSKRRTRRSRKLKSRRRRGM